MSHPTESIRLFYSYSHKDESYRVSLVEHLSLLRRQGFIWDWHDRKIGVGAEWAAAIDDNLKKADVVLLLVSSSFLASDYCYDTELQYAMSRHKLGDIEIVPIIIRSCDWHSAPFSKLQALPRDAKPIQSWEPQDDGWTDVAKGIRELVKKLQLAREGALGQRPAFSAVLEPEVQTLEVIVDESETQPIERRRILSEIKELLKADEEFLVLGYENGRLRFDVTSDQAVQLTSTPGYAINNVRNLSDESRTGVRQQTLELERVANVTHYPFSAVCSLVVRKNGKSVLATGFLVGPNLVITAGNNLCHHPTLGRGYVDSVGVYVGRDAKDSYVARGVVTRRNQLKVSRAWRDACDQSSNWGIIVLNTNLGHQVGCLSMAARTASELKGRQYQLIGFSPSRQTDAASFTMWVSTVTIDRVGMCSIQYRCDLESSGAPLIAWDNELATVVGLHIGTTDNNRHAVRFTPDIIAAIKSVLGEASLLRDVAETSSVRSIQESVTEDSFEAEESADSASTSPAEAVSHAILAIHGIRDFATWHQTLSDLLGSQQVRIVPVKYGWFSALRFLAPWDTSKSLQQQVYKTLLDTKRTFPSAKVSVIAHSFGTHLFSRVLQEYQDVTVWRIVFCGSVVKQNFEWARVATQVGDPDDPDKALYVVNDCGNKDVWPAIGSKAGWRYGNAGTDGFSGPYVTNRFHSGGHSLFFDESFIRDYWEPFLLNGKIRPGEAEQREGIPWLVWLVQILPCNLQILAALVVIIASIFTWQLVHTGSSQENLDSTGASLVDLSSGQSPQHLSCLSDVLISELGPLPPILSQQIHDARDSYGYDYPDVDRFVYESELLPTNIVSPVVTVPGGINAKILVYVLDADSDTCSVVVNPSEFHEAGRVQFPAGYMKKEVRFVYFVYPLDKAAYEYIKNNGLKHMMHREQ